MNKKEIILKKGQCPFEKLQEVVAAGTENAWIFIHKSVLDKMYIQEQKEFQGMIEIRYNEGTQKQFIIDFEKDPGSVWKKIRRISGERANFIRALDPENLIFLKAQE